MSKYAVVETGSKQYRVEPQSVIEVELLNLPEGQKEVVLDQVLLIGDGENVKIGAPSVQGAKVICDFLEEFRGPKVVSFKFRRRKASRKKHGHRQDMIRLKVKEIVG